MAPDDWVDPPSPDETPYADGSSEEDDDEDEEQILTPVSTLCDL